MYPTRKVKLDELIAYLHRQHLLMEAVQRIVALDHVPPMVPITMKALYKGYFS